MSSSSVPPEKGPYTDEDLLYLQLFEEFINYPSDDTSPDALNAVTSINKTVEKHNGMEDHAKGKAKSVAQQDASHSNSSNLNVDSIDIREEDGYVDPALWEDFLEWMAKRYPIDVDVKDQRTEGVVKDLATHTKTGIQCSSEYEQNKENVHVHLEHNPTGDMPREPRQPVDQQLPSASIPQNNVFVRRGSLQGNTINNNLIIPAQTQTLANVQWPHLNVRDNGSGKYNSQPTNEVRWPNVNDSYYRTEFIQGSSKDPSFLPYLDYTNEGRSSRASQMPEDLSLRENPKTPSTTIQSQILLSNSLHYMPSTWSKRPREDSNAQFSPRPHKRHNGGQSPPCFPSMPTPSQSLALMRDIISPEPPVLPGMHEVTSREKGGQVNQDRDECGNDENAKDEEDEDAEGEECGEDDYEEYLYV
ncbi:hypothetical protein Clacol_007900 [Clathrus columnatus]|uniref:Uncharacterized protein n=1 Tax=Clathrus columnatus TaxID=1419009 RepID=A0AAV5ALR0_9AGAM|nr:hypothetical protein Clacol_007900 [Clathrus columnatus]